MLSSCGGGGDGTSGTRASVYSIGGTATGLIPGRTITLTDSGSDRLIVTANGPFTFAQKLGAGTAYSVAIGTAPAGQTCTLANAAGTVGSSNITNVAVACTPDSYTIGGTVSGLPQGTNLELLDNAADVAWVNSNGPFTFATAVPSGASYEVTVGQQPSGRNCTVAQGAGTVGSSNVSNVSVGCAVVYSASAGDWTWVGGSSSADVPGVYGSQGAADAGNVPGARNRAAAWTGLDGSLWLFGGAAYLLPGPAGAYVMNDMWKYDPHTGLWTWVSGPDAGNVYGVYGTRGVPASTNLPEPRTDAVTWTDPAGNLWLFGGFILFPNAPAWPPNTTANDLWEFNPTTGLWTWVAGPSGPDGSAVYGTPGIASSAVTPGAGAYGSSWTDSSGNLWLFGGYEYVGPPASQVFQLSNDLWEFTPATGMWMNMNPPAGPTPRLRATSWVDAAGNFWLFGGEANSHWLNDLWKYVPSQGVWTLVGGSSQPDDPGSYGSPGIPSTSNLPRSRAAAAGWRDPAGNLWLFGGSTYGSPGGFAGLNDLWELDPNALTWTWWSGTASTNGTGSYGQLGVSAPTNLPSARESAVGWADSAGNLWLFGGDRSDQAACCVLLNDLWVYTPN